MAKDMSNYHRCAGIYGPKYKKDPELIGTQCRQPIPPGKEFCDRHWVPPEKRCTARYSPHNLEGKAGLPCTNRKMTGQQICGFHGGHAFQNKAAGLRRVAEEKLERQVSNTLARLDVEAVDNPLAALSQLAGQVVAWQNALADKVNALSEVRYQDARGGEQLRSEVALYERAMDRCNTVLGTISRLNIDERMAVINEKQTDRVIAAIEAVLDFLGVTGDQAVAAKRIAAQKLRAV